MKQIVNQSFSILYLMQMSSVSVCESPLPPVINKSRIMKFTTLCLLL